MEYNPQNYSEDTRVNFEILGSHILNIYYTHIYSNAKAAFMDKSSDSITDAFCILARQYLNVFSNPQKMQLAIFEIKKI